MRFILLLFTLNCCVSASEPPYNSLLSHTGLDTIISGLDSDLQLAASRHARRCDANQSQVNLSPESLMAMVAANLQESTVVADVQFLESWYKTSTGRKVSSLEQGELDELKLKQFQTIPARSEQVARIYKNTRAGFLSASIAVQLEHAGWLASGCMNKVRSSGDSRQIGAEQIFGDLLKDERVTLETLFRQSTLHTMEFVLSPLSMSELIEYADMTDRNGTVYTALVDSLISAIQDEVTSIVP